MAQDIQLATSMSLMVDSLVRVAMLMMIGVENLGLSSTGQHRTTPDGLSVWNLFNRRLLLIGTNKKRI